MTGALSNTKTASRFSTGSARECSTWNIALRNLAMSRWPPTCGYCGAPMFRGACPRCNYRVPPEGKIVLTGVGGGAGGSGPLVITTLGFTATSHEPNPPFAINNVTAHQGSSLVLVIAWDNGGAGVPTVTWNGLDVSLSPYLVAFTSGGTSLDVQVHLIQNAIAATGTAKADFGASPPHSGAIMALEIQGTAASSLDNIKQDVGGTGTDAVQSFTPNNASDLILCYCATLGPTTDTPGVWSSGMTTSRRIGTTGGSVTDVTISEAYRIVPSVASYPSSYTGFTSRDYGAPIVGIKIS
jgi:hypothetical protein